MPWKLTLLYFPVPLGHATVRDDLQCSSGECVHHMNTDFCDQCRYLQLFLVIILASLHGHPLANQLTIVYEYTVHAQNHPQATESPNDEPTCPAVQSTQVTEQEDTGELTS